MQTFRLVCSQNVNGLLKLRASSRAGWRLSPAGASYWRRLSFFIVAIYDQGSVLRKRCKLRGGIAPHFGCQSAAFARTCCRNYSTDPGKSRERLLMQVSARTPGSMLTVFVAMVQCSECIAIRVFVRTRSRKTCFSPAYSFMNP